MRIGDLDLTSGREERIGIDEDTREMVRTGEDMVRYLEAVLENPPPTMNHRAVEGIY